MKYNLSEYKATCAVAFESNYGIKPKNKDISIIDKSDDRTYIIFTVGTHLYRFKSHLFRDNSVWCGTGTVLKIDNWQKVTHKDGSVTYEQNPMDNPEYHKSIEFWNCLAGKFVE